MRTCVVSTHLDDAVLSAFAILGPETLVVTVLAGLPPGGLLAEWDALTGASDSRERVAERRLEDRRALEATGARYAHLEFADGQYVDAGAMAAPTPAAMAAALVPHLAGVDVLAPAGIGNTDHVLVRDAVLAIRPDATLYADLPYALRDGWDLPRGLGPRPVRDVTLDERRLAAKLAAVAAYPTQLPRLTESFGGFADAAGLGRERFWAPLTRDDLDAGRHRKRGLLRRFRR